MRSATPQPQTGQPATGKPADPRWRVVVDYLMSAAFIYLILNPQALEDLTDQLRAAFRRTRDRMSLAVGVWQTRREVANLPETDDPGDCDGGGG